MKIGCYCLTLCRKKSQNGIMHICRQNSQRPLRGQKNLDKIEKKDADENIKSAKI